MSLSTKYSCSRWCNKICRLSILSEILSGGQDKPPWTACPPPLVNMQPKWMFEVSISVSLCSFQLNIPVVDGVIKFVYYQFSLKFWADGKVNRPGQLASSPCQNVTQLNVWTKHLRLTEIKFTSLSTKYSCSRWCNKICVLSILSEILSGGQDKPPWTACPPPPTPCQYATQLNVWSKHLSEVYVPFN